jgi:hypothetical protein
MDFGYAGSFLESWRSGGYFVRVDVSFGWMIRSGGCFGATKVKE